MARVVEIADVGIGKWHVACSTMTADKGAMKRLLIGVGVSMFKVTHRPMGVTSLSWETSVVYAGNDIAVAIKAYNRLN